MAIKFSNNASASLASSITNVATSISVAAGQGALFPALSGSDYFYATLVDSSNNLEIVKVTARSTDTLTVVRGQDGTVARAYAAGDKVEVRVVAAGLNDLVAQSTPASTSVAGIVQLNNTVASTSATQAATANAVKTAYDLANTANSSAVKITGDQTIAGVKTFTGGYLAIAGVTGAYTGKLYIGAGTQRHLRCVTATNAWEMVNAADTAVLFTFDNVGNFTAAGDVTAYSDERLKKDWASVDNDFVEKLAQVQSGTYTRIDNDLRQAGVSAQSLQTLLPEVVREDVEGNLSVAYGNAAMVSAVELAKKIVELEQRLKELEAK